LSDTVALDPSGRLPVELASFAICDPWALPTVGVGQPAMLATSPRYIGTVFWFALRFLNAAHFASVSSLRTRSTAVGVGQPAIAAAAERLQK
jgi:hypothetical protein